VSGWAGIAGLLVVLHAGAPAEGSSPVSPDLLARAGAEGSVRVIVSLRLAPGVAPDAEAIRRASGALLQEIAGTRHQVVRTYETVPLVALDASVETLRALAASPRVLAVEPDAVVRPQGAPAR
jgi:hypothetical protein